MTWSNIEDILYDGTPEEISRLTCPKCGGSIHYIYSKSYRSIEWGCLKCQFHRGVGSPEPNCAKFFGPSGILPIAKEAVSV